MYSIVRGTGGLVRPECPIEKSSGELGWRPKSGGDKWWGLGIRLAPEPPLQETHDLISDIIVPALTSLLVLAPTLSDVLSVRRDDEQPACPLGSPLHQPRRLRRTNCHASVRLPFTRGRA